MKKFLLLVALFSVACLVPSLQAQSGNQNRMENNGVSVEVPKDWTSQSVKDPLVFLLVDPRNSASVVVVREVKSEMGVKDLQEYFDFKLEKIAGGWEAPKLGEMQKLSDSVFWKQGTATLIDPKKIKIPSNVLVATAEGKEYYYLILISERAKSAAGDGALLRQILESLKVE